MRQIEFYSTPSGEVIIKENDLQERTLEETDYELIDKILSIINEFYPEAYGKLMSVYDKSSLRPKYRNFLAVRRFIKCNFGNYDKRPDIDGDWRLNFEFVSCPLRGGDCSCENKICIPKFNSNLSERQLDVMRMCYDNKDDEEIAEALFISPETAKNHRKNSFKKLGIHSMSEFIRYANNNNLF